MLKFVLIFNKCFYFPSDDGSYFTKLQQRQLEWSVNVTNTQLLVLLPYRKNILGANGS